MKNNNKKGLGIASMILGIIGASFLLLSLVFVGFSVLSVILGIIGLFLGIFAKRCGQKTAGIVLNILSVAGALVIVPIILGIKNDAKEQAKQRQAELIAKNVQLAYTSYLFDTSGVGNPDNFCEYMDEHYFGMGDLGFCISNSVFVRVGSDVYTIAYENGIATVTGEDIEDVTVRLGNPD